MFHVKPITALLVNPYIYDFSAYSFWSSPLGLLTIGAILRKNGFEINILDCLRVVEEKRKGDGRAPFLKEKVKPPDCLEGIKKRFRRYGIAPETLKKELAAIEEPHLILITSIMTYWYPGAREALTILREVFPSTKIIVGGIYPSLCYEHAQATMQRADMVISNRQIEKFYAFIEDVFPIKLSYKPSPDDINALPYPAFDLYETIPFVPLLTSVGCMYKCTYCATPYMHPRIIRRQPQSVLEEICYWHERGVKRYVIYDDNFLYKKEAYAKPLLRGIARLPFSIDIYNPNALNASLIDSEIALLLKEANFKEVRVGFETKDAFLQQSTGGKINTNSLEGTIHHLFEAGFKKETIGAYILAGLPFQRWEDVKASIDYLSNLGVKALIAEYTPIPHTPLFQTFYMHARYPIKEEPLFQNNALFPFAWEGFTEEDLLKLKHYVREKNRTFDNSL
jgi:radical SAM superfamily enzyme YgiQ (UPF0313 family)